jgi:hypothetical protein
VLIRPEEKRLISPAEEAKKKIPEKFSDPIFFGFSLKHPVQKRTNRSIFVEKI